MVNGCDLTPPTRSGVTDGGQGCEPPPGKLNAKTWPPLSLYFGFSTDLVFSRLFFTLFGVFSGDLGF